MKSIAKAFVIGSLVVLTQAAWAGPLGWGNSDLGSIIPTQSTYADEHGAGLATVSGDFPLGAEALSARAEPHVRSTYQSEHPVSQTAVAGDFPMGAGQIRDRAEPPVRTTYQAEHAASQTDSAD